MDMRYDNAYGRDPQRNDRPRDDRRGGYGQQMQNENFQPDNRWPDRSFSKDYGAAGGQSFHGTPGVQKHSASSSQYVVDKDDPLDAHVAYYLRHHPDIAARHRLVRKRPGVYELNGREVMVEWQYAANPGEQGFLVVMDGPLRQPFSDYMQMTEANAEYDSDGVKFRSNLHMIPRDKRMSFGDTHKVYTRLEAMKVAKEQAIVREKAADYVKEGTNVPHDLLMQKYKKTISQKLGPNRRQAPRSPQKEEGPPGAPPPGGPPPGMPAGNPPAPPAMPAGHPPGQAPPEVGGGAPGPYGKNMYNPSPPPPVGAGQQPPSNGFGGTQPPGGYNTYTAGQTANTGLDLSHMTPPNLFGPAGYTAGHAAGQQSGAMPQTLPGQHRGVWGGPGVQSSPYPAQAGPQAAGWFR
eukprot:gnl/TRDRNA2_/TRDRNA2_189075_c0_seq1.p1 gnl/TRDRNA2_/TRDRNA2_189075_c0~~gnl/TRDRNA2_/TRDRNA2_189075_c0_seq1.p1  ORF type:complete len:406 (+),score=54.27 gnl/TRDRNA2_/TRDRNA2_189075_c0_seq1:112-1329(+)